MTAWARWQVRIGFWRKGLMRELLQIDPLTGAISVTFNVKVSGPYGMTSVGQEIFAGNAGFEGKSTCIRGAASYCEASRARKKRFRWAGRRATMAHSE